MTHPWKAAHNGLVVSSSLTRPTNPFNGLGRFSEAISRTATIFATKIVPPHD